MKPKILLLAYLLVTTIGFSNFSWAKGINMKEIFFHGNFRSEERTVRVKNPIKTHITIMSTPEEIQKQQRVDLQAVYENPKESGEIGYFNTRLSYRDVGLFSNGREIFEDRTGLPTDIKPRPVSDDDFIKIKPGEKRTKIWHINLGGRNINGNARDEGRFGSYQYEALEGTHQYEVFVAGNHTLPSVIDKVFKETNYAKLALTVDTQSNTVTFTYTRPPKEGKDTGSLPPPATPDKLNDAGDPDSLALPRLPLGTQVSSLRSCPETGVYQCPADAPGVLERRIFIEQHQPMPSAFVMQPKSGVAGFFGGQESNKVETIWTLVGYEKDGA